MDYKPFLIAVGGPGAYSQGMSYEPAFDTLEEFGLYVKHTPFSFRPKVKNIISQTWLDEEGDDVYIPENITHEAYNLEVEFVYCGSNGDANEKILNFLDKIEGKWLQIYDSYTRQGRQAVYVESYSDEPKFFRRKVDVIVFRVNFRVNDPNTNIVLQKGV